jgi:hypothetical protein
MKYSVTIKNEEYQTYGVEAESQEAAEKKIDTALLDGSLWECRGGIQQISSGTGDFWEVEPDLTQNL